VSDLLRRLMQHEGHEMTDTWNLTTKPWWWPEGGTSPSSSLLGSPVRSWMEPLIIEAAMEIKASLPGCKIDGASNRSRGILPSP